MSRTDAIKETAEKDGAFLAAIVESSDDAIISKNLNSIINSWNKGAERIFGYKAEEVIGQPVTILIPPERISEEAMILERIRKGERVEHYETVRCRKDGSHVDVSLTVSPIRNGQGELIGASKIARDISEQRRNQERLRLSEERFRVTLSSIGDAVIATDSEGRVTFMNSVAEKLTGWEQREALGVPLESMFKIVNEITRKPVENPVTRVLREGTIVGLANHTVLVSKDGIQSPIDDSAAPIRDAAGQLRGVVLVFRDATKERAAMQAGQRLASMVDNSGDAIYSEDLNGIVTSWNKGAELIFGYSAQEAIGRPITASIISGASKNEAPEVIRRILNGERLDQFETTRTTKDGREINVSIMASPIKEPLSGRILGIYKVARDITGRKQMERDLASAHTELENHARNLEANVAERTANLQQTIAELEAFSFTISHDLRSPLRAMQGFAQAVLEEYADKLDARGRGYLERISNSAIRLDTLIREVLTYSRVGRASPAIETVDLEKLVDEVIQTYPSIHQSHAEITTQKPLHPVLGSRSGLVQCVSNLLGNAVKFVAPQTRARVRIWTETDGSKIRFYVEDNGIGIPEDLLSKIFEPFQRGHPHAGYEGTGMGLAIVRKATQRMGGTVGVHTRVGHGSKFWLELTAAEPS